MRKLFALVVVCGLALGALWAYSPVEGGPGKEHHPHIRQALRKLQAAKRDLQTGARDFHGHRKAAVGYIDRAINECHLALKADRK